MSERTLHRTLIAVVFLVSFITYWLTMAVTVTFWDSGEFIATSYILGIPHSPGTPLYVLVGRVFSMLPLAMSVSQRVNFLSVFFGALGVVMAYLVMVAVIRFMYGAARDGFGRFIRYAGPLVGAFYLTFSDTYWRDATEAEVYALSAFVMGFCTLLALRWYENPSGEIDGEARRAIAEEVDKGDFKKAVLERKKENWSRSRNLVFMIIYLLSLGIGFHLGTIIVYGGIFLLFLMVKKKAFSNLELFVFTFGMAVVVADCTLHRQPHLTILGLVVLAILIVWSTVFKGKFALVATGLFALGLSVHIFLYIRSSMNPRIDMVDPETWRSLYAHLRREQYPPATLSALMNRKASFLFQLQHFGNYFREQFRMLGDLRLGPFNVGKATFAIPAALGFLGMVVNFTRERRTWVLNFAAFFLNSLGLIIFLNFSDSEVRERDYFYGAAFYYFSVFIGIGASALLMMFAEYARREGRLISRWLVPVGVLLLVLSVLPARYHWFTHDRSRNYIARDYAYNMLAGLEPDAIIFTNGDNDTFPLWYIQNVENFRTDVRVANLSLLNTSWYIRQLRDEDPRVPISLGDREIDQMRPIALKGGKIAWKRDLAVNHIIQETRWSRPIYFAVTVPTEAWEPYSSHLEMQGMARRLVTYQGKYLFNDFMITRNFDDIFEFRGVLTEDGEVDNSVYKDSDTRGMFMNFAIAAFQLAQNRAQAGDYDRATSMMELSLKFNPEFEFAKQRLGQYYLRSGDSEKAIDYYAAEIERNPSEGEYWIRLADIYERLGQLDAALDKLQEGARMAPDFRDIYGHGFRVAALIGRVDVAKDFVRRWLERHPDDKEYRALYDDIDRVLEERFGIEPEGEGTKDKEEK